MDTIDKLEETVDRMIENLNLFKKIPPGSLTEAEAQLYKIKLSSDNRKAAESIKGFLVNNFLSNVNHVVIVDSETGVLATALTILPKDQVERFIRIYNKFLGKDVMELKEFTSSKDYHGRSKENKEDSKKDQEGQGQAGKEKAGDLAQGSADE